MRRIFKTPTPVRCGEIENPTARWGFLIIRRFFGLAVLLTLLTALAGPRRLLLLLLTRFLLATTLLMSALLLAALLLLTRLLVWILIHLIFLSNIGSKRHLDRSRPMARDNAWRLHSFPFTGLFNFDENVSGTCRR